MKTASQVRRNRTKPATNSQRENRQPSVVPAAAQLGQFRRDRARPIDLDLPGIAGGNWDDQALLHYVCSAFAGIPNLLAAVARDDLERYCSTVDFVECVCMVRTIAKHSAADEFTFPGLGGLAGRRAMTARQCLETVCLTIYNLKASILRLVGSNFPDGAAVSCAQALMIAERVTHRAGYATDLESRPRSGIARWAEELTRRVASESLQSILSEASSPK